MDERIYGSLESVTAELKGKTEFDADIEQSLIERIAEIEKNNGVVPGLGKADWTTLLILGVLSLLGCIYAFTLV